MVGTRMIPAIWYALQKVSAINSYFKNATEICVGQTDSSWLHVISCLETTGTWRYIYFVFIIKENIYLHPIA